MILRLVGGSDVKPAAAPTAPSSPRGTYTEPRDERPSGTLSATAENGRLREKRYEAWREAEAMTRYWRARLDFHDALSFAQRRGYQKAVPIPLPMTRIGRRS